ncbi:MAG: hypothetical protein Hyperionvirus25_31 [Hyperionvirus sp.]|uniref:Uncharacterized protein n=1 Tax=Hyperionvirus sp. TaxID=2487770 RepID=A0A3G5AB25_9VIRU|nr:MAG: hypothetical protein Hyperionvirus25_31 [Hyperionvirus sp.]
MISGSPKVNKTEYSTKECTMSLSAPDSIYTFNPAATTPKNIYSVSPSLIATGLTASMAPT